MRGLRQDPRIADAQDLLACDRAVAPTQPAARVLNFVRGG